MRDRATLESLHSLCRNHRHLLEVAPIVGCFHCKQVFPPTEIEDWLDEGTGTAFCPRCGIDSVIPQTPSITIDEQLLSEMFFHWFCS
jgi:hypothetical protein